jgi:hypothetical protein
MNKIDLIIDALDLATETSDFERINILYKQALAAARELKALAQPEQEPVGWFAKSWQGVYVELMPEAEDAIPFYTAPPKREWVGLHLDDMPESYAGDKSFLTIAKWAEAKLKEKNGG